MTYHISPKGKELGRRMFLENPCEQGSEESFLWIAAVMMGLFGDPAPTDQDVPATHEGYEWGQAYNREWQSAIDIADRISNNPPPPLLTLATEATAWGIAQASPALLQSWAAEILTVPSDESWYWAQIAADLRSLAMEKMSGEIL